MRTQRIKHFLIVYNKRERRIEETREYLNSIAAIGAYFKKEKELFNQGHDGDGIEVVLIGSDSLGTVKITHPNYFDSSSPVSKYLAELD